jgi:hypothetical protein
MRTSNDDSQKNRTPQRWMLGKTNAMAPLEKTDNNRVDAVLQPSTEPKEKKKGKGGKKKHKGSGSKGDLSDLSR